MLSVAVAHRQSTKFAAQELGITAPIKPALVFAAVASAPMLLTFAIGFSINHEMTLLSVAVGCFIAPFAEEVLFRGYLFRQLYQRAKMGFWLSALIPSVLFAAGHAYQSTQFSELAGILAGGWLANGARFTTVALAILLTIFKDRFWKTIPSAAEIARDEKKRSIENHGDFVVGMRRVSLA